MSTTSGYSSTSSASSRTKLPYIHPIPSSSLYRPSQPGHRKLRHKYHRFYATPMTEIEAQAAQAAKSSTPVEIYGYEPREPSISERPKVFRRFSRALEDAAEDFSAHPLVIRNKRTSALFFDGVPMARPQTTGSPNSRPRPVSMASFQPPFVPSFTPPPVPEENFRRRFSRRLSVFGKSSAPNSISPPISITSSPQCEEQGNFF